MNPKQISRIAIRGFKSIRECDFELGDLNVVIGANGAGKSNFINFFRMIQQMLEEKLQVFVTYQVARMCCCTLAEISEQNRAGQVSGQVRSTSGEASEEWVIIALRA